MKTYVEIDLHTNNSFVGVIDQNDKRLYSKRHENRLKQVFKALSPFKGTLKGIIDCW